MSNDVAVVPKKSELIQQIGSKLEVMITDQIKAFPKEFNKTRFVQNCLTVLADTKDIELCKPMSVVRTLIKGAYLNLDFFRRECYAIPYKDKETGDLVCNFQTDYKGERKLCLEYGRGIKDVYAKVVQDGDVLEIGIDSGLQTLTFKPKPFNNGKIIGAFAVIINENGLTKYETMSIEEIEEVRQKFSKAPDSPAWKKSFGEMCKKVVMRRLCKLVDLHFENHEQEKAYDEGADADFKTEKTKVVPPKVGDPFAEEQAATAKVAGPTDAEIVDKNADLRAELMKKFPSDEPWQIDVRIKELNGVKA